MLGLEQFADGCHRILTEDPGPEGRKKVCALVQEVLTDDTFIATHLGDDVPERKILYEDPKLGFCILAHAYKGAKESNPHDHGPSWAIYGQARIKLPPGAVLALYTDGLVESRTRSFDQGILAMLARVGDDPGKVRHARAYPLKPGMAKVYNVGDVHSPKREGATRLIRIEGTNMDKVKRLAYERA